MLKELSDLIAPALAFFGALCGSIMSARLERKRMHFQYGGKENAREALKDMLNHKTHVDRSFDALHARVPTYSRKEVGDMLLIESVFACCKGIIFGVVARLGVLPAQHQSRQAHVSIPASAQLERQ